MADSSGSDNEILDMLPKTKDWFLKHKLFGVYILYKHQSEIIIYSRVAHFDDKIHWRIAFRRLHALVWDTKDKPAWVGWKVLPPHGVWLIEAIRVAVRKR